MTSDVSLYVLLHVRYALVRRTISYNRYIHIYNTCIVRACVRVYVCYLFCSFYFCESAHRPTSGSLSIYLIPITSYDIILLPIYLLLKSRTIKMINRIANHASVIQGGSICIQIARDRFLRHKRD